MRAFLYGSGWLGLVASTAGLAFLPWLAPNFWIFAAIGAACSVVVPCSWLLLGATAGDWPRPRTGWALIVAGLLALVWGLSARAWLASIWGGLTLLSGLGLTFPPFAPRRAKASRNRGPVRAPVSRREL